MKRWVHAVAWILLALSALVLWPQRWGGSMTYVITNGDSMAPRWQAGDLAVLRESDDYRVGNVVAYDSAELDRIVMHRVVEATPAGYRFQGDNNDFVDPETVSQEQVLGKLVARVPGVGRYVALLTPVNVLIAAAGLFLLLSDRRKASPEEDGDLATAAPLLRVSSVQLPATAVLVRVVDRDDLDTLARSYGRPVLEIGEGERRYVVDGAVVYTWGHPATRPASEPDRRGCGTHSQDWAYGRRHLQALRTTRGGGEQRRGVSGR